MLEVLWCHFAIGTGLNLIQKREMKLSGVSIFFENARKIFKSNLVVLVVLKSKGPKRRAKTPE